MSRTPRYRRRIWPNFITIAPLRARLLGRSKEAMADAEKALPIARSAADSMLSYRIRQFIGLQKQAHGRSEVGA